MHNGFVLKTTLFSILQNYKKEGKKELEVSEHVINLIKYIMGKGGLRVKLSPTPHFLKFTDDNFFPNSAIDCD